MSLAADMFRTLAFTLTVFIGTAAFGSVAMIAGVLGVPNRHSGIYDKVAHGWSRLILWVAGTKVAVYGLENIPKNQPVVFVSNHQSWFDIWILAGNLPGQVRFVAKKELGRIPILGRAMRSAGHIIIDRQNRQAALAAYEEASATINSGMSAVVFAEGTRSRTGELLPFKKGPFVLAIAAQVPVVPVYCAGTFELLPKGSLRVRPKPVAVVVGKPMSTLNLRYEDRDRFMADVRLVIERLREDGLNLLGELVDGGEAAGGNGGAGQ